MQVSDIPEIARLTTAERILLLEDLWDDIASEPSGVLVPQSHKEELDRRHKQRRGRAGRLLSLEELEGAIARRT